MESIKFNTIDYPVLRVTQLDTHELDDALLMSLKKTINQDFFKYIQYNFFQKYNIEIFAAIKFLLWYNTYYKNSQTIGQSILDWKYQGSNLAKTVIHCVVYCLDEFIQERFPKILKIILFKLKNVNEQQNLDHQQRINKILNIFTVLIKSISFINYLVFLFNGEYLHIWERVLNLRPTYLKEQKLRSYDHERSVREELWQTYFSLFKLINSFVNFNNVYSKIKKRYAVNSNLRKENENFDQNLCAICEKEPTVVHCSVNMNNLNSCKHVFCYFCIKKALLESENKFNCFICNKTINDIELFTKNENL